VRRASVGRCRAAAEESDAAPPLGAAVAGIVESFVRHLDEKPLLRIHLGGGARRHAEMSGVKERAGGDLACDRNEIRVVEQLVRKADGLQPRVLETRETLALVHKQRPELLYALAAGKASRHADDGDGLPRYEGAS
jgi:hypothetical protein